MKVLAILLMSSLALVLTVSAHAQSFNVEVGAWPSAPSPLYTAAAGQAGVWNVYGAAPTSVLVDLAGNPTSVQLSALGVGTEPCDPTTLSGDDAELLEDNYFSGYLNPSYWTISGLEAGTYDFYVYLYTPCNPQFGGAILLTGGASGSGTTHSGIFTGTWIEGVTHVKLHFTLASGAALQFTVNHLGFYGGVDGFQLVRVDPALSTYCFGDGTGTACPCGVSAPGNGCPSSFRPAGANLGAFGTPSLANDTLQLSATSVSNSVATIFQGTQAVSAIFGDGLRCAGGSVVRITSKLASANTLRYPEGLETPLSHIGGTPANGETRRYQVWYRNAASYCTPSTFNLTNGLSATWQP